MDGKRTGQGTYTYANGSKYSGEFRDAKFHGQGTFTHKSGMKEVGEWANGKLNGYAIKYDANGNILAEGIWKDDEFLYAQKRPEHSSTPEIASNLPTCPPSGYFHNCFGPYTWQENGDTYVGEWKNDDLHGQGILTFGLNSEWSGDKYVGEFRNGKRNGQGTYTYLNGDKYVGDFRDGEMTGQGTLSWTNSGSIYVGEFKNSKRHGQGTYTFGPNSGSPGDKYIGEFRDDKRNGQGTYIDANGNKYVGEYRDSKKHGQGILTWSDGTVEAGIWKDGEFQYAAKSSPPIQPDNIVDYSLLLEEEGSTIMYISQLSDGSRVANINILGGYTWFEKTFKNPTPAQVFIQPFGIGVEGDYSSYTREKYEIGNFSSEFSKNAENDQFLSFNSKEAIAQINSFIATKEKFTFAGLTQDTWYAGTFQVADEVSDLINLAEQNPDGFCFLLGLPIMSAELNRQFKVKNIVRLLNNNGVHCDEFNNVVFQSNKNQTITNETLTQQNILNSASTLPKCVNSAKIWSNCFASFILDNGDIYVGEWRNNKRDGEGTYTFADGNKYTGEFKNGQSHGEGTFIFGPNSEWAGDKYVGEFKLDKFHGEGEYSYSNGDIYIGEFKLDEFHGQGQYTFGPNSKYAGEIYMGEFRSGKKHGHGVYTHPNGDKYVGEYKQDQKHGQGTYTFASGDKYVGEYRDGEYNGRGTYTYENGVRDVGEFRDGKLNGFATRYASDGSIIKEGIWIDDEYQYAQEQSPPSNNGNSPSQADEIISASSGSGFAVSGDGYVITNHHVIEGCAKVLLYTQGKEIPVTVMTYDLQNDLALLKGEFEPSVIFSLSDDSPELLQDVFVAGFPFGEKFSTSVKVTKGIISSLTGLGNNFSNFQIDAALQSGNSGGPILDDYGNVIGVAVAKLDAKYMFEKFGIIPENTNFGIKSSVVKSMLTSTKINFNDANSSPISRSQLAKMISEGTYYVSCWMTMAQIEKMKNDKVFFSDLR